MDRCYGNIADRLVDIQNRALLIYLGEHSIVSAKNVDVDEINARIPSKARIPSQSSMKSDIKGLISTGGSVFLEISRYAAASDRFEDRCTDNTVVRPGSGE